jgi:hypothetical protein
MHWGLYAYRHKSQTEDGTHDFSLVRRATEGEVETARAAIADLSAHSLRESFVLIVQNHEAFSDAEEQILKIIEELPQADWPQPREMASTLRFHFFNWLMSTRAFLDSTKTQLSRRYGSESPEVQTFVDATAEQYDSVFAYRFFWKLRNYAQHWDWPRLDGRIQVDVDQDPSKWLELYFDRNLLLAYDGWGPVRRELETLPDEIHLEDLIDRMMESIREIAARVYELDAASMKESLSLLGMYWEEIQNPEARPCFVLTDEEREEGVQVLWIPFRPSPTEGG